MFRRKQFETITKRLKEPRRFIQVVIGPRQVGKSTLVKQVLGELNAPFVRFAADNVPATNTNWISDCWSSARAKLKVEGLKELILVIDEVQKIHGWSEAVKKEWDDDCFHDVAIKVVLLGSSRAMLDKGLSDSLQGRFERIALSHWNYAEMNEAFGWDIDKFIYHGGYPGVAPLVDDPDRWTDYIAGSIIDATINKDILVDVKIAKPALLRQALELSSAYSGKELSLTKMIGQLQDAGNTTTISGYLELLGQAGLVCGLYKYSNDETRRRSSVPKHQVYNNALKNVFCQKTFEEAVQDRALWGHIFESAIGAHIVANAYAGDYRVYYWREGDEEVDYVIEKKGKLVAIEVKSNSSQWNSGLSIFSEKFHPYLSLVVGDGGMKADDFLKIDPATLF